MPKIYIDLDNNRAIAGSSSTQLAPAQKFYQGEKPQLDLELLRRKSGVLSHYTSTASAINVRVGLLGQAAVASATTFSAVTLSATAVATCGITVPVAATGTASMLGSATATATVGLNSPVTGTLSATLSPVQMPTIVPIVRGGAVDGLEVPTCGNNFSTVPCVVASYPDALVKTATQFTGQGQQTFDLHTTSYSEAWPEVLKLSIDAKATMVQGGMYDLQLVTGTTMFRVGTVLTGPNPPATAGYPTNTTDYTITYSTTDPDIISGSIKLKFIQISPSVATPDGPQPAESFISGSGTIEKIASSSRAVMAASLASGKISVSVASGGSSYLKSPDVFVIPSSADYDLGTSFAPTSAEICERTVVVTKTSHGLSAGNYIAVENLSVSSANNAIGAGGIWRVDSATSNAFTFRIDRIATHSTTTKTLSVTSAKIYPVQFRSMVTSVAVACAGSGYPVGIQIPWKIAAESCYGLAASGVVTVSNSGQLLIASVSCAGSGFSSASTVVTIQTYKSINGISVTCAGAGYWDTVPTVSVSDESFDPSAPGSSQAVLQASLNGNGSIQVSVVCSGYGYLSAPTVTISSPNSGNGIRLVKIATKGVGYSDGTFACSVASAPAGGTDAVVNFVKSGTSQGFVVVNSGRGYVSTPAITVPGPDLLGEVTGFTVTCAGNGYSETPLVLLSGGGGSGAAGLAILSNGSIVSVALTESGSGYTSAPSVIIQDPPSSVYYTKQIDFTGSSVTTLLGDNTSASAYLQIEEKTSGDISVLAQIPVTIQSRIS